MNEEEIRKLKLENETLKQRVYEDFKLRLDTEMLKQRIELLERKHYTKVDLNLSSHVRVLKSEDGTYKVASQIVYKDFRLPYRGGPDELELCARAAEYTVKDAYIKSGFDWILESEPCPTKFENLKIYIDKNVPVDSIYINPRMWVNVERMIVNIGQGRMNIQNAVRFIVDRAMESGV